MRRAKLEGRQIGRFYPHYEMKVIERAGGFPARVYDAFEGAIYPERYQALQEWSRNSPEGKFLRKIFGEHVDAI